MLPTTEDVDAVLRILGMRNGQCVCAYCGDPKTEWDHFRSIVDKQKPTGYITEIANLVPACGKCNQSKGSKHWKAWMLGPAKRSPATRGIPDLKERVARLEAFESWRKPVKLDYPGILGAAKWQEYMKHWDSLLDAMKTAQAEAEQLRALVESHLNVV